MHNAVGPEHTFYGPPVRGNADGFWEYRNKTEKDHLKMIWCFAVII